MARRRIQGKLHFCQTGSGGSMHQIIKSKSLRCPYFCPYNFDFLGLGVAVGGHCHFMRNINIYISWKQDIKHYNASQTTFCINQTCLSSICCIHSMKCVINQDMKAVKSLPQLSNLTNQFYCRYMLYTYTRFFSETVLPYTGKPKSRISCFDSKHAKRHWSKVLYFCRFVLTLRKIRRETYIKFSNSIMHTIPSWSGQVL